MYKEPKQYFRLRKESRIGNHQRIGRNNPLRNPRCTSVLGLLEPTIPSNDSIERFMFESDQDQIVQITEQLHAAKSILDENPDSLPEMEWLEYQFFTHMYLSSIYRKSTTGTSRDSFDFILENQTKAVEYIDRLIEKDPVYETDRAFPELELNMLTCR